MNSGWQGSVNDEHLLIETAAHIIEICRDPEGLTLRDIKLIRMWVSNPLLIIIYAKLFDGNRGIVEGLLFDHHQGNYVQEIVHDPYQLAYDIVAFELTEPHGTVKNLQNSPGSIQWAFNTSEFSAPPTIEECDKIFGPSLI